MPKVKTNNEELMDRASIALDIAGAAGLSADEVRYDIGCGTARAYTILDLLVKGGYAARKAGTNGRGCRYVFLKAYPATED